MRWRVLVTAPYMQGAIDRFQPILRESDIEVVLPPVSERCGEEELLRWIGDVDGVICGDDQFTEQVLRAGRKLRVISKWGTGIDSIDQDACARLGIAVRNTPNAFSDSVADTVMGYVLCFARQIPWLHQDMSNGLWRKLPGVSLSERTLGIVGVGDIGKAVARRAVAFGMRVVGTDLIRVSDAFLAETGIEMASKDSLLREADFVSVNCTLNPTSHRLLATREFLLMKRTAYLINTARGPIVDEDALTRALRDKHIAGAALDVFENEPLPADSELRKMDNVLLAPHNANASAEAWERVHRATIDNLIFELQKGS